jgi:trehalose 6-phosphate synthase/phosphatase
VSEILSKGKYDLIMSIGDDVTDENMFKYLPKSSITIKVGKKITKAKYYVDNVKKVRSLLNKFFS